MFRGLVLLLISFFAFSCAKKDIHLIVVSDDVEISRQIEKSLPRNCEVSVSSVGQVIDLSGCNLLWIHGVSDSSAFDSARIIEFVKKGGNLVLTSGAVRQLNHWGLEPEMMAQWRYSDAEFAQVPFYSHPVFADLHHETLLSQFDGRDFSVYGFEGDAYPQMKDAAVIAVAYEEGNVCMDRKTMWEIPLIHGKVLASGAGFPYGETWADMNYLKKAASGIVSYLIDSNLDMETDPYCGAWSCDSLHVSHVHAGHHIDCKICAAEYKPVKPRMPETLELPKGKRHHMAKAGTGIELSEDNICLKADEVSGISELWIDGVRIVKDYRPLADIKDVDTVVSFSAQVPYIEMHKKGFTRTYDVDGVVLTESVVLSPEHSSVVIHYQWSDPRVRQMFTEHKSDLAFGYPYDGTMMSLYHVWSLQLNATVVRSEDKNFCSIVGSNVPGRVTLCGRYGDISYKNWRVRGTDTDDVQTASSVVYGVKGLNSMDVVISGTASGTEDLLMDYAYTLRDPKNALELGLN